MSDGTESTPTDGPEQEGMSSDAVNLMAALAGMNARDAAFTGNALMEGYRKDAMWLDATLRAVRSRIFDLIEGDFMPTTNALLRALNPSDETIESFTRPDRVARIRG